VTRACAPIALFVYNRPAHTERTLAALAANGLASSSQLIIFSDGPRAQADAPKVDEVRALVSGVQGFAAVQLVISQTNQGLAKSIIHGVTRITQEFGRVIVVEDDLETSPHFLTYMNDALDRYADHPQVAAISAYHSLTEMRPETFFLRDAECWGWATWSRAWSKFDPDGASLLARLKERQMLHLFDQDSTYPYTDMLRGQIAGTNDSWAIRWRAHVILNGMLSLYPRRSLVSNIGLDGSGTHSEVADFFTGTASAAPVRVADIPVIHSAEAYEGFKQFNRRNFGSMLRRKLNRLVRRLRR
jgi:hypothetical protein